MYVLKSDDDGSVATLTISIGDDDHKFEIWAEGDTAYVEYQESLTWRGTIEVSEPDEDIFKELIISDEVTEFLEEHDCQKVKRSKRS